MAAAVAAETSKDAVVRVSNYDAVVAGTLVDVEFSFKLLCYIAEYFSSSFGVFYI